MCFLHSKNEYNYVHAAHVVLKYSECLRTYPSCYVRRMALVKNTALLVCLAMFEVLVFVMG